MRTSVIVVTTFPLGFDLTINGLLGQIETVGMEPGQKYDPSVDKFVDDPEGEKKPVIKGYRPFELIIMDTTPDGATRATEVEMIERMARSGDNPVRRSFNLPTFDFQYVRVPELSVWEAIIESWEYVNGEIVMFLPEFGYAPPRLLSDHELAHSVAPIIGVSNTIVHRFGKTVSPNWLGNDREHKSDLLGILLDPDCEPTLHQPLENGTKRLGTPFGKLLTASFPVAVLDDLPTDAPQGFEINTLALWAWNMHPLRPTPTPVIGEPILMLDPKQFGTVTEDAAGYEELCAGLMREQTTLPRKKEPAAAKPWWKRALGLG